VKIYIMTDLEGATGVVDFDAPGRYRNVDYYQKILQYRKNLTEDINAAVEAAAEYGVKEITVRDGHSKETVILEKLNPKATLIRGTNYRAYLPMLDSSFDSLLLIGYHSKAGTSNAVLAHTNTRRVRRFQLNARRLEKLSFVLYMQGIMTFQPYS